MDDEEIEALQKQLFDLRVKQATKQDLKTSDFKKLRKDIARRKTAQTSGDWSAVERMAAASDSAASGDSVAMFAVAGRKGMPCSRSFLPVDRVRVGGSDGALVLECRGATIPSTDRPRSMLRYA